VFAVHIFSRATPVAGAEPDHRPEPEDPGKLSVLDNQQTPIKGELYLGLNVHEERTLKRAGRGGRSGRVDECGRSERMTFCCLVSLPLPKLSILSPVHSSKSEATLRGTIAGVILVLLTPVHRQPGNPTVGIGHDPAGSR
jgi:hypothetical protein